MIFRFLLAFIPILLLPLPGLAQSERRPTAAEIESLLQELHQEIPRLLNTREYMERRTPEERQQREAFVEAWAEVDRAIAPFLGDWSAIEESISIFPSLNPNEVCIIDSNLDGSTFYLGRVVNGNLYTDKNHTFIVNNGFLGNIFIYHNRAEIYEYSNPRSLYHPSSSNYYRQYPQIIEQFQQAGCLADELEADSTQRSEPRSEDTSTLILNEQGFLSSNSPTLADDGSHYQIHSFQGRAGQNIVISMESNHFDTFLALLDSGEQILAQNDDISRSNTNSQIRFTLPYTGTYHVLVNTYDASGQGSYTVTVR